MTKNPQNKPFAKRMIAAYADWLESDKNIAGVSNFALYGFLALMGLIFRLLFSVAPIAALMQGTPLDGAYTYTPRYGGLVTPVPVKPALMTSAAIIVPLFLFLLTLFAYWRGWFDGCRGGED